MVGRESRSNKIPAHNSPARALLTSKIFMLNDYKEKIKQGYPLFTEDNLKQIEKRYKNLYKDKERRLNGLTWDDIEKELLQKNIVLKKPTFRKYIQENHLPKSIGYVTIGRRRMAIFPTNVIMHFNFIHYLYKIADKKMFEFIMTILKIDAPENQLTYLEAVEAIMGYDNIYTAIYNYLMYDDGDIIYAIEKVLTKRAEDKNKLIYMLEDIDEKFRSVIFESIGEIEKFLKERKIRSIDIPD